MEGSVSLPHNEKRSHGHINSGKKEMLSSNNVTSDGMFGTVKADKTNGSSENSMLQSYKKLKNMERNRVCISLTMPTIVIDSVIVFKTDRKCISCILVYKKGEQLPQSAASMLFEEGSEEIPELNLFSCLNPYLNLVVNVYLNSF